MNLVDDLDRDLAIAFLVEKKYSKKLDSKESLALIRKIREALNRMSQIENGESENAQPLTSANNRGN